MKRKAISRWALLAIVGGLASAAAKADPPSTTLPQGADQEIFYDTDGLIVHHGDGGKLDGGDTSQREGWYWLGVWTLQNTPGLHPWTQPRSLSFDQVLALLEPNHDGIFYRHPKLPPWNDPHDKAYGYSRDQMEPLVAAMGVWGKQAEIRRMWDALPEDLLGKHAFNGNWRNFLGQDGQDCSAIKRRGCDATADCSLKMDDRDCSLAVDTRDCSLKTDDRDCSLQQDTRSCGHDIVLCLPWPLNDQCHTEHVNDPICEAAKAGQNAAYKAAHDACEAGKAWQNTAYKAEHDGCEAAKGAQNAAYKVVHDQCEAEKAIQNAGYKAEHDACEAGKTAGKLACEAQKAADQIFCLATNVHSGDLLGPMTVNLFRRAMGEDPMIPISASLPLPPINVGSGPAGEAELAINVGIRLAAATKDRGDTGDDLNLLVKLLVSKLRFPSPLSESSVKIYAENRPQSFGSFLGKYRDVYGADATHIEARIAAGIGNGWAPECAAPVGAARWYHRVDTGANPALAELWKEIVDHYIH